MVNAVIIKVLEYVIVMMEIILMVHLVKVKLKFYALDA
jgi:hypothetical protein